MAPGVILILGAGPRIGAGVALEFASHGFKVAVSSRSRVNGITSPEGYLEVKADLFQPETIPQAFETVRAHFGNPPNVVVFNGKMVALASH
jgi:NAD(P)-dependent dehydrogenase (short-subunit alcohol dehydrogenase family)